MSADLIGAWYQLGASLLPGRPVDPDTGWPVLTTREAVEVAQSWGLVLARLGPAVEPVAARWLEESRALLLESDGPDELLPGSSALWGIGAVLLHQVAQRNAGPDPAASIRVSLDDAGKLRVANVGDPLWLELALRRFFVGRGRTEKIGAGGHRYAEVSNDEARQVIEIWDQYAATAKPLDDYRDPRIAWRTFTGRASSLLEGSDPAALFTDPEGLAKAQRRLGLDFSVLKDNQPLRGWSGFARAAIAVVGNAAAAVGQGAASAAGAVASVARGSWLKPVAIGAGALAGVGVLVAALRR